MQIKTDAKIDGNRANSILQLLHDLDGHIAPAFAYTGSDGERIVDMCDGIFNNVLAVDTDAFMSRVVAAMSEEGIERKLLVCVIDADSIPFDGVLPDQKLYVVEELAIQACSDAIDFATDGPACCIAAILWGKEKWTPVPRKLYGRKAPCSDSSAISVIGSIAASGEATIAFSSVKGLDAYALIPSSSISIAAHACDSFPYTGIEAVSSCEGVLDWRQETDSWSFPLCCYEIGIDLGGIGEEQVRSSICSSVLEKEETKVACRASRRMYPRMARGSRRMSPQGEMDACSFISMDDIREYLRAVSGFGNGSLLPHARWEEASRDCLCYSPYSYSAPLEGNAFSWDATPVMRYSLTNPHGSTEEEAVKSLDRAHEVSALFDMGYAAATRTSFAHHRPYGIKAAPVSGLEPWDMEEHRKMMEAFMEKAEASGLRFIAEAVSQGVPIDDVIGKESPCISKQ